MDSLEVIDSSSGSFTSKDYSFLPEVLVHSVQNVNIDDISQNLRTLQAVVLSTASPDDSMEDINSRLMDLMDKNNMLKETMNKNNLLLKNLMNNLPVFEENKQNLEKAKGNINLLEKEKADLHKRLTILEDECLNLRNQKTCKNCESLAVVNQELQTDKEAGEKTRDLLLSKISKFSIFHTNLHEVLVTIYDQLNYLYCTAELTDRQKEEVNTVLTCLKMKINVLNDDFCSIDEIKDLKIKQKIQTSEEFTAQISTEVANLRKQLKEKKMQIQTSEEFTAQISTEVANLRKQLEEKNMQLQKSEELILQASTETEKLKKDLEQRSAKLHLSDQLVLHFTSVNEKQRKELQERNKKLQTSDELLLQSSSKIENLEKELEAKNKKLQTSEELLHESSIEIENLKKELEEKNKKAKDDEVLLHQATSEIEQLKSLEARNKKLHFSSETAKQVSEMIEGCSKSIQSYDKCFKTQLQGFKNKLDRECALSRKYKKRCENQKKKIDEYKLKITEITRYQSIPQLHEESANLQQSLELEQCTNQEHKEQLSTLMVQCEKLETDYNSVTQHPEIQSESEGKEEIENDPCASHMSEVDHLTARVIDLELKLEQKDDEMQKVLEELISMKDEAELIPVLQAQIDYFKTDLEHAVSTRDSAHFEIEKLEKELKKFRRENSDSSGYYSSRFRSEKE